MELNALEQQCLNLMVDRGVADAALQLSSLSEESVSLSVSHLHLSPISQVLSLLRLGNVPVACIAQDVSQVLSGRLMLMLHADQCLALINALIGKVPTLSEAAEGVVQHEALTEIGNIIISAVVGALDDGLNLQTVLGAPEYSEQKLVELFEHSLQHISEGADSQPANTPAVTLGAGAVHVLVMSLAMVAARCQVTMTLALMLTPVAVATLRMHLKGGTA
ncbi:MAG: hypothetical protein RL748_3092 [Pseudomonadota bacterium]|jgi:chemotaxis protein CheY-P-specific phosphatase CheC